MFQKQHVTDYTVTSIREESLNSASNKVRKTRSIADVVRKEREERVCGTEEQTAAMGKYMRNGGK